jgi:circadian clock protein KaiC
MHSWQLATKGDVMVETEELGVVEQQGIAKAATGIEGFDEITGGGLPRGRPTLICGTAGCGKTLFGMEFLVRGATQFGEPGVFMAFEEAADELTTNVRSLGFDLDSLVAKKTGPGLRAR